MPKSFSNLWPQVTAWAHLVQAYHRCRLRKRFKPEAAQFDYEWETHLVQLQRELLDGSYQPGAYHHFHIQDPKPRKISAAPFRDRIVHHAIVGVLEPIYERRFVHVLLDGIDHFIKEELRIAGYVRYADDLLLFGESKPVLWSAREALTERLVRLRLRLHPDKTHVTPSLRGVPFLGFRIAPTERRLLCSAVRRFQRRVRLLKWRFSHGMLDGRRIGVSLRAWLAHVASANSFAITKSVLRKACFTRSSN